MSSDVSDFIQEGGQHPQLKIYFQRFSLVVAMSVAIYVSCPLSMKFCQASHWPSDHMISSSHWSTLPSKKNDASPFGAGRGKQKKYRCFYSSVREILCLPLARFFFTFLLSHNFNFRLIAWFFSFILEFGCHVCKNQHFRNVALHDH